jgi:hypothetical protein
MHTDIHTEDDDPDGSDESDQESGELHDGGWVLPSSFFDVICCAEPSAGAQTDRDRASIARSVHLPADDASGDEGGRSRLS